MTVAKVIELVGHSPESWEGAVKDALKKASETVDNITGVEVYNMTAQVREGEIVDYKANVKLAFEVDDR